PRLRAGARVRDAADGRPRPRHRPAGDGARGQGVDPRRDPVSRPPGAEVTFADGHARGGLLRTPLWVLALAGIAAGVAVAGGVAALQPSRYRAVASLLVQRGTRPATTPALVRTIR